MAVPPIPAAHLTRIVEWPHLASGLYPDYLTQSRDFLYGL